MLHHLTRELAENEALRNYFDFTWHIVICAEPDKAKLNEGWFKGRSDAHQIREELLSSAPLPAGRLDLSRDVQRILFRFAHHRSPRA